MNPETPRLPKILDGRPFLDLEPGTSIDAVRRLTRGMSREVLSVFDQGGNLLYAPLVGEVDVIVVDGFRTKLRDRIVTHNHPTCTMLSHHDLLEAIDCDMARIEAVCGNGAVMAWNRPDAGWPDREDALRAYRTALRRASKNARFGRSARDELRKQADRALGDAGEFGDRALTVSLLELDDVR